MTSDNISQDRPYDAASEVTGSSTEAWIDDNPVGRCTASHLMSGPNGTVNVRCDGQAGHGGDRHQSTVNGVVVYWRDDPASRADESEEPASGEMPQGDGS
jgi:hypothetical protein